LEFEVPSPLKVPADFPLPVAALRAVPASAWQVAASRAVPEKEVLPVIFSNLL
jgi:hypothetical protein